MRHITHEFGNVHQWEDLRGRRWLARTRWGWRRVRVPAPVLRPEQLVLLELIAPDLATTVLADRDRARKHAWFHGWDARHEFCAALTLLVLDLDLMSRGLAPLNISDASTY